MFAIEKAARPHGTTVFPCRWYTRSLPPTDEAARVGWIRANIVEDEARGLSTGAGRATARRLAELTRRRYGDA